MRLSYSCCKILNKDWCMMTHFLFQILFARAEALHAHGHTKDASRLAQRLALDMLSNPPDLIAESASAPSTKRMKSQSVKMFMLISKLCAFQFNIFLLSMFHYYWRLPSNYIIIRNIFYFYEYFVNYVGIWTGHLSHTYTNIFHRRLSIMICFRLHLWYWWIFIRFKKDVSVKNQAKDILKRHVITELEYWKSNKLKVEAWMFFTNIALCDLFQSQKVLEDKEVILLI